MFQCVELLHCIKLFSHISVDLYPVGNILK